MMKKKRKIRRAVIAILCVFLVLYPNFTEPLKLLAEDKPTYISDIKLYIVDTYLYETLDEAVSRAQEEGFTLIRDNLNNGSGILASSVYLGYKTTEDPEEAITDIRTLAMDRDYYLYNYNELREYLKSSNESTANTMYRASQVFADNYRAGSPKAIDAYEGLNLFYVDKKNEKLGDYILEGKADLELFLDIAIKASSGTAGAVLSFLNTGIAPYEQKQEAPNWAVKLQDSELREKLNGNLKESERNAIAKIFDDAAQEIFAQIQDFTTHFENASIRKNYDVTGTIDYTITNEEGKNVKDIEDAVEAMDSIREEDSDALYLATYENLNQYYYDDETKLGDWLVETGRHTVDEVNREELYPLVDAMGDVQTGLARTLGFVSATANLSKNVRNEELQDVMPKIKDAILDYNGGDCISLWDNADDDIENSYIAYTSDAIRKSVSNNSIGKKTLLDVVDEKFQTLMKWVNIGMGVLVVGAYVLQNTFAIAATGLAYYAGTAACVSLSAMFTSMASFFAMASVFLAYIGLVILAMTIMWALITFLWGESHKMFPQSSYTHVPAYVFDAAETADGPVTVKYKTIRNEKGGYGDVNHFEGSRWQVLCYTKDKAVGSPLMLDSNRKVFVVNYGNSAGMLGYDCINFFGERSPADLNSYASKNSVNGIYVSYRTERSIRGEGPNGQQNEPSETTPSSSQVSYLADIIVSVANSENAAKAKIMSKEGKYYILDFDLSKSHSNYTYIGYALTTDPKQAITDIRIAPYHGTDSISFGEVSYTYASHLGLAKEDGDNSLTPTDALCKTKDPRAGSPILADGLHAVTEHSKAEPGWEPVTLFCGLPYNFASAIETFESGYENDDASLSGYSTDKSDDWGRTNVYLYYEPTEKYTEGEQYLSGLFCINGYKISKTLSEFFAQTTANMGQLKSQILKYPNAAFFDTNLAQTVQVDFYSGAGRLEEYLGYTWTYNPKRAICDITAYQGDSVLNTLSYTISKPVGNAVAGYAAVSTICQQGVDESIHLRVSRFISPTNAIINDQALLVAYHDYKEGLMDGYTKTLPRGFACTWEKSNFLPLGLYVCGAVSGKEPLKLRDIVVSGDQYNGTVEESQISYYISGASPDGRFYNGETAFHSIYELKNPYETEALNIAYPQWYNKSNSAKSTTPMYIYLKGAIPSKPKYIASVSVGSYSREQYKSDMLQRKSSMSDDEVKLIDISVNSTAMLGAVSSCSGETICVNVAAGAGEAWYQRGGSKASGSAAGNVPAAYLGISRTDKASRAITGILLYQNDARSTEAMIKIDGAEYYCDSTKSPIIMDGKRYFLYYTRNRGVLTGARVQDIFVDASVLSSGMATALCSKAGSTTTSGELTFPNYIHMKFDREDGVYYTQLHIGKGSTAKEALYGLAAQECFQYIDLDLNTSAKGSYLYLGYSTGYVDMMNSKPAKIKMAWSEAVWDIIVTDGLPYQPDGFVSEQNGIYYTPVSDIDLNDGADRPAHPLYMYYCSPVVSEEYNDAKGANTAMPDEVFSAPISKMAFARYDRVPYNSSLPGTDETGSTILPWEYVMLSDHSAPADFNAGAFWIDNDGYMDDNRITMFLQRYDGSFKPCGQITGGFLDEYMYFGEASIS